MSQEYGNGITTDYSYNNVTRRLTTITTLNGNSQISTFAYTYDPVGNVTQVTSSCPWLNSQSLTESFTYDASDQLVSASETQAQSYQLAVTYGNWGKITSYSLAQTDLQHNTTQSEVQAYTYPATNSIGNSQTLFAPQQRTITDANNNVATETLTFGINGSLRKREVQAQAQASYTEYYLFNSAANLKAYSNNGLDFAYYGYNASNTRTYKLNFLNANSWVNGQQLPIHPQSIQAMFYPNAYVNFNHNGEYTKHYYNGSERIASRLGNTALSISMEMTDRLQERVGKLETRFQDDIRELVYTNVQVETPPVSATSLQQTGTPTDIFYYHTNHLGSTAYVTDNNATITQGFLYAPFGEITTEYNANFGNNVLPKYSFNAKELDEETGMYYYEARYYKPPVFTSRDAMMEKKPWLSPYHYCSNNPVGRIDPSGMFDKEKQAEKSREKALKQYGRENVSNILKNEDGQYYYNIYGNTSVSYRNDGCKTGGYTRLNTAIVKLETRQVLRRSDYRKCIRQDQLGLFSRTNEISFGFAFGTTGAVFCLDAYPDYIPLKEAKIAKGFYKAGKFASGVGVVAGIANVVNSSIRAADDGRISFGEGLRICIQLGATISSGFPGIGTAISLGISTIDLFWGDSIEKIGSK